MEKTIEKDLVRSGPLLLMPVNPSEEDYTIAARITTHYNGKNIGFLEIISDVAMATFHPWGINKGYWNRMNEIDKILKGQN